VSTPPRIFTPEYYERLRQLEEGSWWNAGMRDIAAMLLAGAGLPPSGTLLDIGCGSGQTLAWFERLYPRWRSVGLDLAAEGLRHARRGGRAQVLQASATSLPLQSQAFDLIITLDVLQHLPLGGGDVAALGEMARVIKPGGYLFLRTNAQAFPFTPDDPIFNFHKYEPHELREKLAGAGFRVLRLSRVNAIPGLAEIPRELRARRQAHSYHGILAPPPKRGGVAPRVLRAWLGIEGAAIRAGLRWPLGRSIIAVCRKEVGTGQP